jgi:hypothetical protein
MAGVEEVSQFELKIKYTFGRSQWILNDEKNILECYIKYAFCSPSLTEKLTTDRTSTRVHNATHYLTKHHQAISTLGPRLSITFRRISSRTIVAKDRNTIISHTFNGPPFPCLSLILSTRNFRNSRHPGKRPRTIDFMTATNEQSFGNSNSRIWISGRSQSCSWIWFHINLFSLRVVALQVENTK